MGYKELAEQSLTTWAEYYCKDFLGLSGTGEFHEELDAELDLACMPGNNFVGVFPRGHAKSTRGSQILPAYLICTGKKKHICLVGYNTEQAEEKMSETLFLLQECPRIREDYGDDIKPKQTYGKNKDRKFKVNEVEFSNNCVIAAFESLSRRARGRKKFGRRPDLYILDDPEDEQRVDAPEYREKFNKWLYGTVIPSMDPHLGSFIWLGTRLHYDSPLSKLVFHPTEKMEKMREWRRKSYKAYDENPVTGEFKLLWPEWYTMEALDKLKATMGDRLFNREYLHEVIDEENQVFKPEYFREYDRSLTQKHNGRYGIYDERGNIRHFDRVVMACDPAFTDNRQSDFTAITVVGMDDRAKRFYILAMRRLRGGLENMQAALVELYKEFRPDVVGIETSAAQVSAAHMLIKDTFLPIKEMKPTDKKQNRIYGMEPHFINGRMWFPDERYCQETRLIKHEAEFFPTAAHDDMMDSLAMALELLGAGTNTKAYAGRRRMQTADAVGAY